MSSLCQRSFISKILFALANHTRFQQLDFSFLPDAALSTKWLVQCVQKKDLVCKAKSTRSSPRRAEDALMIFNDAIVEITALSYLRYQRTVTFLLCSAPLYDFAQNSWSAAGKSKGLILVDVVLFGRFCRGIKTTLIKCKSFACQNFILRRRYEQKKFQWRKFFLFFRGNLN